MNLSELLTILYTNRGSDEESRYDFFLELTDNMMHVPESKKEKELYAEEKYNPFFQLKADTIERYVSDSGQVNVKHLKTVYGRRDANRLAEYLKRLGETHLYDIEIEIKKRLPGFNSDEGATEYVIADLFIELCEAHISGKKEVHVAYVPPTERLATAVALGSSFFYDAKDNTLHLGEKVIQLPDQAVPPEIPKPDEDLYIKALLAAYAHDLGRDVVLPEELTSLHRKYRDNFSTSRISYYSAVRICRFLRESFTDAEEELELWKKQTKDYIIDTLNDDYDSGYRRLVAVLKMVVNCTTTAAVDSCNRLIGPNERKGVCHLLANEGEISWVFEDE